MTIFEAIAARDDFRVKMVHHQDANVVSADGMRPLEHAIRVGQLETIRCLLQFGADPNARSAHGRTPLHIAEDPECIRMLRDAGAYPDVCDTNGETPLRRAVKRRDVGCARALLERGLKDNGADPNLADGLTVNASGDLLRVLDAATMAALGASYVMVDDSRNHLGDHPLRELKTPLVMLFKETCGFSCDDRKPLDDELAQLLLDHGAYGNATVNGNTCLDFALCKETRPRDVPRIPRKLARSLLRAGCMVCRSTMVDAANRTEADLLEEILKDGYSASVEVLIAAACPMDPDDDTSFWLRCVDAVLDSGVDVDAVDEDGCTALFIAERGREIVELLVRRGADVNFRCLFEECNWTPLLYAAHYCSIRYDNVVALIKAGADVDAEGVDLDDPANRWTTRVQALDEGEEQLAVALIHAGVRLWDDSLLPPEPSAAFSDALAEHVVDIFEDIPDDNPVEKVQQLYSMLRCIPRGEVQIPGLGELMVRTASNPQLFGTPGSTPGLFVTTLVPYLTAEDRGIPGVGDLLSCVWDATKNTEDLRAVVQCMVEEERQVLQQRLVYIMQAFGQDIGLKVSLLVG